jgi:hypothetical protein
LEELQMRAEKGISKESLVTLNFVTVDLTNTKTELSVLKRARTSVRNLFQ